jgi:choline kinase
MNVIVMAAGVGSRLNGIAGNKPKCLIKAGGETLIRRNIDLCRSRGLRRIAVVTGYRSDLIEAELGGLVHLYHNPFYAITNSLASLWFARDELEGDVLLMNGDLFFEPQVLDMAIAQTRSVVMLSDSTRRQTADYRFGFCGDRICRHGKTLSVAETDAEHVGIVRVDRSFLGQFRQRMDQLLAAQRFNDWWEDVLYSYIPQGEPIYHHDVAGSFWTEIDNQADYDRLRSWVGGAVVHVLPPALDPQPLDPPLIDPLTRSRLVS